MSYSKCSEASIVAIILLCALHVYTVSSLLYVEQRVVHVLPDNSSQEACPVEHCFTLKKVIESKKFASNTKIILHPAVYVLSDNFRMISISKISNIVITCGSAGDLSLCYIRCKSNAGFFFQDVTNASISGLSFENCGARSSSALYGGSITLLFRFCTDIILSKLIIAGRVEIGIEIIGLQGNMVIMNTTLKGHREGVCFYAAMDNRQTLRPLILNLMMKNVSFVDETYDSTIGATCLAILMQSEYYVKIHMADIYIEKCNVDILSYDVCKTNANLQHATIVDSHYRLSPDIMLSVQMSRDQG